MKKFASSLGQVSAIIGMQWGDEGKGKVTDILGAEFDVIARASGGANAGHTIVVGGKKHVFHLLPAGCLHEGKPIVLGSGMVIHLATLLKEIALLRESNIDVVPRLQISGAAHILLNVHKEIDGALEAQRSKAVGTTKRGIGPAYMDKAARTGIRMEKLNQDVSIELQEKKESVKRAYGIDLDIDAEQQDIVDARKVIGNCIIPCVSTLMRSYIEGKKSVLIEGAQAVLLDIDHGTYPFVTSSATTTAGALQGLGLPPSVLTSCIGVAKAYCTRVGAGDFPGEETGKTGDRLRERGGEYGSTTGRPRRCGWLSIADLQYSAFLSGCTHINLTKLDVLDEEDEIPVIRSMDGGKPVWEKVPGWKTSTKGMKTWKELPVNAQKYVAYIEKCVGCAVSLIGTGQGREEMIVR